MPNSAERKSVSSLQDERRALIRRSPITLIQQEEPDSQAMAHILYRGQYDQKREEVIADLRACCRR
ncbi:MAG: hypothetical protein R2748_29680 [Bryobacterales bacterium]